MPEAIATTKRKFYRALDTLANPPATRAEPAAKRVRRSTSTTSTVSRITPSANTTATGDTTPKKPPNYAPWSHEAFLTRLKTFSSVSLWHPKPEAIDEVEWAKRGWSCVDVNTVACTGGCGKRVLISLNVGRSPRAEGEGGDADDEGGTNDAGADDADADDDSESQLVNGLVRRYQLLIVEGHSDACTWRKAGCKDDIYHLQVVRPTIWQPELKMRYKSLRSIDSAIQEVTVTGCSHETASSLPSERVLDDVPTELLEESEPSSKDAAKALEIALHGWRGSHDSGNDLLHCDACFQRIGLWMYQPGYRPSRVSSDDDEEDTVGIDLLEMHRDHCPWRNPDAQHASGSLGGLNASQILQRVVSTYAREQRRKSEESQKTAQQLEEEDREEETEAPLSPAPSMVETARQDKDRESRLKKLKSLFSIKRRPTVKTSVAAVGRNVQA